MRNEFSCPGCGAMLKPIDGPTHKYMRASPACWAAYGELLAAEYSDPSLFQTHRLCVDAYAVQHPGDNSRQAIQSVGLHLARLLVQLEAPRPPDETNDVMLRLGQFKATLVRLPERQAFQLTVADIAPHAGSSSHVEMIKKWARSTWRDWEDQHKTIRQWVNTHAPELLRR